jgi:hypothetical protein
MPSEAAQCIGIDIAEAKWLIEDYPEEIDEDEIDDDNDEIDEDEV